jgi:hypothetical protein
MAVSLNDCADSTASNRDAYESTVSLLEKKPLAVVLLTPASRANGATQFFPVYPTLHAHSPVVKLQSPRPEHSILFSGFMGQFISWQYEPWNPGLHLHSSLEEFHTPRP